MKLSEMTTEQVAEAMLIIAPEIQPILSDAELMAAFKKKPKGKQDNVTAFIEKACAVIPLILGKHKESAFRILGAVSGMSVADIKKQNILVTIKQLADLASDKELIGFFMPSEATEPNK